MHDIAVMSDFVNLEIWKEAHRLYTKVCKYTNEFPIVEQYALSSQFKRAASSISANISEGYRKTHTNEKLQFYNIALCSLQECKNYSIASNDLKYINDPMLFHEFDILGKRIAAYIRAIKNNPMQKPQSKHGKRNQ